MSAIDDPEPLRLATAPSIGIVLGSAYAVALTAFGLWNLADNTYPLAFGLDLSGEGNYPIPFPEAAWVSVIISALGLAAIGIFARTATGSRSARWWAIGFLALVPLAATAIAQSVNDDRRCAVFLYTGAQHCVSDTSALIRDTVIISLPAVVAIGLLALGGRPSHGAHPR